MGLRRFGVSNCVLVLRLFEVHQVCCDPSSHFEEEEEKKKIKEVVLWA